MMRRPAAVSCSSGGALAFADIVFSAEIGRDQVARAEPFLTFRAERREITDYATTVGRSALADHVPVRFSECGRIIPADLLALRDVADRNQEHALIGEAQPGVG